MMTSQRPPPAGSGRPAGRGKGGERPITWGGRPARQAEGSLDRVAASLPTFTRGPFELFALNPPGPPGRTLERPLLGPVGNPGLDLVYVNPLHPGGTAIPVAAVSKTYRLIQHTEAAGALAGALERLGVAPEELRARLLITEHGERMHLRVLLPARSLKEGGGLFEARDGHPLQLEVHCLNSVDGSTAFQVQVGWYRQVCTNGLLVSVGESRVFRQIHRRDGANADLGWVEEELLRSVMGERAVLRRWEAWPVNQARLAAWVDDAVAPRWGVQAAARVYHVSRLGVDGTVEQASRKARAHERRLLSESLVPGAAVPSRSVYDVCQALCWVADHDPVLDNRILRLRQIPSLAERLMKAPSN